MIIMIITVMIMIIIILIITKTNLMEWGNDINTDRREKKGKKTTML